MEEMLVRGEDLSESQCSDRNGENVILGVLDGACLDSQAVADQWGRVHESPPLMLDEGAIRDVETSAGTIPLDMWGHQIE